MGEGIVAGGLALAAGQTHAAGRDDLCEPFFAQNRLGYGALLSIAVILAISVFIFTYRRFANLRGGA